MTVVALALLAILCAGIAYFVYVVHSLEQARSRTAEDWRQLAVLLDRNYRHLEIQWNEVVGQPVIPAESADSAPKLAETLQQFHEAIDRFRTTVDVANQRRNADAVERILAQNRGRLPFTIDASDALRQDVVLYNQRLDEERAILQSPGGRLLRFFLVVPELPEFRIDRAADNM